MNTAVKVIAIVAVGGIAAYFIIGDKDNQAEVQARVKPTFREAHTQGFRGQVAAFLGTSNIGRGGRRTVNGRSLRDWRINDPVYGGGAVIPEPTVDPANPMSPNSGRTPTQRTGAGNRHTRS